MVTLGLNGDILNLFFSIVCVRLLCFQKTRKLELWCDLRSTVMLISLTSHSLERDRVSEEEGIKKY